MCNFNKLLSLIILGVSISLLQEKISAQTLSLKTTDNNVKIESFAWFPGQNWQMMNEFFNNYWKKNRLGDLPSENIQLSLFTGQKFINSQKEGFIYQITVQNNSAQKITSLTWEYIFRNPLTGEELGKHTFTNFEEIKSNKKENLFVFSDLPPTNVISVELLKRKPKIYLFGKCSYQINKLPMNNETPKLIRGLNLADAISLVIGTIIGTGIFLKTTVMTRQVGSPELVLLVWAAAGLLSLAGALSYAELGGMLPKAGGEYVYLRAAYGDFPAFLYGWMRFAIGSTGSIAALGAGFAIFFTALLGINTPFYETKLNLFGSEFIWQFGWSQIVAVAVIMIFSLINCAGVVFGGKVQTILTFGKVLGIAVIVIGVFLFTKGVTWESLSQDLRIKELSSLQAFGTAMLAALWAYDGWNNMPMAAGEINQPERNVPRALIVGMVTVIAIYLLTNAAYFHALPIAEIATANETNPVATKAVATFLGTTGATFVAVAIMISIIGTLNGSILTGARVPYAMAENDLFPASLSKLSKSSSVPVTSILIQAVWSCILALLGTFDQLTDYAVFAMWIFYILTTSAVFVLRRKMPDAERPYKTLGYPLTPLIFILVGVWLLINTLQTNPLGAGIGLLLISLGIPIYFYFRAKITKSAL